MLPGPDDPTPTPTDRAELLEQIIATGNRRRRRRTAAVLGGVSAAVLAVALVAWPGGGDRTDLATADDPSTTSSETTASTFAEVPTTNVPASTNTSVVEPTRTTAEPSPVTSEPPPVCRNSHDPACGPFYWDLPPGFANQDVVVSVGAEALQATAGEEVHFAARAIDPDAFACIHSVDLGGGHFLEPEPVPCAFVACAPAPRFGPWDPPPIEEHELWEVAVHATYDVPGTYTITVTAGSTAGLCGSADVYSSSATATFTIEVHAATG